MELLIGKNIKKLRQQRNLTQEEMANHLGISFQSVSKWERGDGYPDITMLPSLANYFGISVDELIGTNEIAKQDKYKSINRLWFENNQNLLHLENVQLMKESLKTFPNDALLLVQLSTSLEKLNGTKEEKENYLRESIDVQEQILRYCNDCEVRGATLYNICHAYWKNGEHKKALEQANKLPNLYKARENALVYFLKGEERHEVAKSALTPIAWVVSHHFTALAETENNPIYYEKALKILDILFDGEENDFIQNIRKNFEQKIQASSVSQAPLDDARRAVTK